MSVYAELCVTSNFSFLRGASHPEELVERAHELGLTGLGLADRNSVAGVVRAHVRARQLGLRLAVGARLVFSDGAPDILAYPQDRAAWGRLTRLLTVGKTRADKGDCILFLDDLYEYIEGLNLIVLPPDRISAPELATLLRDLKDRASPKSVWLGVSHLYRGDDNRRIAELAVIAEAGIPLIAINEVLYHEPARRALQDVVTCIREHLTLETAGRRLKANAERHLKSPAEMARLFRKVPAALAETVAFLHRCRFSLDGLRYEYPDETRAGFATPQEALIALAEEGAGRRYPGGVPDKVRQTLDRELAITAQLKYAPYFLTVHDIVRFARSKGILCQGRGSAANSVICYCLGITEVDPERINLLFERFVSVERGEPPDIDVDFEHERREEVIQYIYSRYGRERAALAATVICYRGRSAIREVGKVFGLSDDVVSALAGTLWGWSPDGVREQDVRQAGLDPSDARLNRALSLANELIGFPRHLSQHVGGFVMTRSRLDTIVPIENAAMDERTVIEWDKDDLADLNILKVDILGLGMLSCLRRSFDLLREHYRLKYDLASFYEDDSAVYAMLSRADSIGVFQVESRAQMSMLPRMKPRKFYDLVIEVAIVRPGPIQGDMVYPYLRRREGRESVHFASPFPEHGAPDELQHVLQTTLGVPLFQEQAMRIAIVAAQFLPEEANRLRRAMATFKRAGTIKYFRDKFIAGMSGRGYPREFAERCFKQIEGFGEYGFPESHAASFANLVYISAWIKCHYPDVFATALLNSQPMGFYAPAQIVRDAAEHGVEIRPPDINHSDWDCGLEVGDGDLLTRLHARHGIMKGEIHATHALRLGLRQVSGLLQTDAELIERSRGLGFDSVRDLWLRTRLRPAAMERLAEADAFGSLELSRRDALWAVKALRRSGDKDDLPLFARTAMSECEPDFDLPAMPPGQEVVEDYRHLRLSLKAHPVSFLRSDLDRRRIMRSGRLGATKTGERITVAGLVLVRQRPGSAKGVIFMTLEDETGIANIIVWPKIFESFRPAVLGARLVSVSGRLQNESGVIHIVADRLNDLTPLLHKLSEHAVDLDATMQTNEIRRPIPERRRHPRAGDALVTLFREAPELAQELGMTAIARKAMPKGRNFH